MADSLPNHAMPNPAGRGSRVPTRPAVPSGPTAPPHPRRARDAALKPEHWPPIQQMCRGQLQP
ncbi:MAG: hypothetical protein LC792_27295, partial [Actinobacteria bacterium]|nr:hypothetical protein [Actinomycetota bacterium]